MAVEDETLLSSARHGDVSKLNELLEREDAPGSSCHINCKGMYSFVRYLILFQFDILLYI